MLLLLDSANCDQIEAINQYFPVDGVTTNPSIISREPVAKEDALSLLKKIKSIIGPEKMLHVQVTKTDCDGMLAEAEAIKAYLGKDVYLKVPVTPEGIKAMAIMSKGKTNLTATAVFTPLQALLAAKAGVDFVAPYVNRLDDLSVDGAGVVAEIKRIFTLYSFKAKVLAASFKNVEQIHKVCLAGADAVTVTPELFQKMAAHPLTEKSVAQFREDWAEIPGEDWVRREPNG